MKKNIIYKNAAIKIVNNREEFCCYALMPFKTFGEYTNERVKFEELFRPKQHQISAHGWFGSCLKPENQLARSLALLFMYEMGE